MKISKRMALSILLLGAFLLLEIVFPPFILDNVVTPLALVVWVLWRILQSVDQVIYWVLLIFAALVYAFMRLYRSALDSDNFEPDPVIDPNALLEGLNYWRIEIHLAGDEPGKYNTLERNLGKMLAALYAAKQPQLAQFEIYEALKLRQMPLPEPIYAFLFGAEAAGSRRSVQRFLHNLWNLPRKQIRRWTGRATAEYYQSLEQVLKFMESVLENNRADEPFNPPQH